MRATPKSKARSAKSPGPVHLVENCEDVLNLDIPDDTPVAYITQTTLSVDDTRTTIERSKTASAT